MKEVAVIGGYDYKRIVPGIFLFNPIENGCHSSFTAVHGPDRAIDVIAMVRPINIPGFDEQPKAIRAIFQDCNRRLGQFL